MCYLLWLGMFVEDVEGDFIKRVGITGLFQKRRAVRGSSTMKVLQSLMKLILAAGSDDDMSAPIGTGKSMSRPLFIIILYNSHIRLRYLFFFLDFPLLLF